MISLILRATARLLMPLMLMFSIFLLLRGHHLPGGGFAGGLMATAAFSLYLLAYDAASVRRILRVSPQTLIGAGLILAASSGAVAWLSGRPFLTSLWGAAFVAGKEMALGTPLFFDAGVYLVAFGATLLMILSIWER